ncbi:MAG: aldehyde dehydrogenase [Treponema sp.]|nr:aldehyde dehydrogenase [Treponema sp.]
MEGKDIQNAIEKQRKYFESGATLPVSDRIELLKKLRNAINLRMKDIESAIKEDLGKSAMESYMAEIGMVMGELSYMIKHTKAFAKDKTVPTPFVQFHSHSFVRIQPYGTVLIMSPWNYPFLLTIDPLVDAIAAGNTVIIKPSAYSPATSAVMEKLINEVFPPEHVFVVTGGREENKALLEQHFDYIFFTGSQAVGKEVLKAASAWLTPCTLELGGKSPCIVDKTANLKLAARRIVWGKFLNCGQTCVAPDYIYVHESVKDELVKEMSREIERQFGKDPLQNPNYGKIINKKHFERILGLIPDGIEKKFNENTLQIAPTIIPDATFDHDVMKQEIFGPLAPVLTFKTLEEVVAKVDGGQKPLALYMFSSSRKNINYVTRRTRFGGGCINDTIIHLATSEMAFGGVGESGMGSYHGKTGFETFSHKQSIVDKKTWLDLPMRYQPFSKLYEKLLRIFLK